MTDENSDIIDAETDDQTAADERELAEQTLAEMDETVRALHDNLDRIKKTARALNGDIENGLENVPDDLREDYQRVNNMAVMAYQRVDRGDHQLVRGL